MQFTSTITVTVPTARARPAQQLAATTQPNQVLYSHWRPLSHAIRAHIILSAAVSSSSLEQFHKLRRVHSEPPSGDIVQRNPHSSRVRSASDRQVVRPAARTIAREAAGVAAATITATITVTVIAAQQTTARPNDMTSRKPSKSMGGGMNRPTTIGSLVRDVRAEIIDCALPPSDLGVTALKDSDIWTGQSGRSCRSSSGGNVYAKLIKKLSSDYENAAKPRKPDISKAIVRAIRKSGGRFMKYNKKDQLFYEIGDELAWKKTCQRLRTYTMHKRKRHQDAEGMAVNASSPASSGSEGDQDNATDDESVAMESTASRGGSLSRPAFLHCPAQDASKPIADQASPAMQLSTAQLKANHGTISLTIEAATKTAGATASEQIDELRERVKLLRMMADAAQAHAVEIERKSNTADSAPQALCVQPVPQSSSQPSPQGAPAALTLTKDASALNPNEEINARAEIDTRLSMPQAAAHQRPLMLAQPPLQLQPQYMHGHPHYANIEDSVGQFVPLQNYPNMRLIRVGGPYGFDHNAAAPLSLVPVGMYPYPTTSQYSPRIIHDGAVRRFGSPPAGGEWSNEEPAGPTQR